MLEFFKSIHADAFLKEYFDDSQKVNLKKNPLNRLTVGGHTKEMVILNFLIFHIHRGRYQTKHNNQHYLRHPTVKNLSII